MWYFSWVLGLGLAGAYAILNGLWHEIHSVPDYEKLLGQCRANAP